MGMGMGMVVDTSRELARRGADRCAGRDEGRGKHIKIVQCAMIV